MMIFVISSLVSGVMRSIYSLQSKWLPLHILAASGDFYLLDSLLKHNVDINALDKVIATA